MEAFLFNLISLSLQSFLNGRVPKLKKEKKHGSKN